MQWWAIRARAKSSQKIICIAKRTRDLLDDVSVETNDFMEIRESNATQNQFNITFIFIIRVNRY